MSVIALTTSSSVPSGISRRRRRSAISFERAALGMADRVSGSACATGPRAVHSDDCPGRQDTSPRHSQHRRIDGWHLRVMLVSPGSFIQDPETLAGWGASIGTRTANGEWWRLATAMFVHASFLHLVANVAGLVQIGFITERFFGRFAFGSAYLGAGLLFGMLSVLLHPIAVTTVNCMSASVLARSMECLRRYCCRHAPRRRRSRAGDDACEDSRPAALFLLPRLPRGMPACSTFEACLSGFGLRVPLRRTPMVERQPVEVGDRRNAR